MRLSATILTTAVLPLLAAARCNHTASDGVGQAPMDGSCGAATIHPSPDTGICGGYDAMCTTDSDCVNDHWCCGGYCTGTCSAYGVQHPTNDSSWNPIGQYNGTSNPIDVYTGAGSSMSVGMGVMGLVMGVVAICV